MNDVCQTYGLPTDLCGCESIAKENQRISIYNIKKKFGKIYTVVKGIDAKDIDLKDVTKKLKNEFACGGTSKDGKIELQGQHRNRVKEFLVKNGFSTETIDVS